MIELSDKEKAVMDLVIQGMRDKEIAGVLGLKRRTVTCRILNVCNKMGALTRAQAAALYVRLS